MVLDPALGALGPGLLCRPHQAGETRSSQVKSVHRVGCALRCLLGTSIGHPIAFHSFVHRGPAYGDRVAAVFQFFSTSMMVVASAFPGPWLSVAALPIAAVESEEIVYCRILSFLSSKLFMAW